MKHVMDEVRLVKGFEHKLTKCPVRSLTLEMPGNITMDYKDEYRLEAVIGWQFWCNNAQLNEATRLAYRGLNEALYGDLRSMLHQLNSQIHYGEEEEARKTIAKMFEYMEVGI